MRKRAPARINTTYRKEIEWLKWYYLRDKNNPKNTVLEQLIADRVQALESPHNADANANIKSAGGKRTSTAERLIFAKEKDTKLAKYQTIKKSLDKITARTESHLLLALKEVYVYENINLTGAASRYLYVSERGAYYMVKRWLEEFSDDIFNPDYRHG